MAKLSTETLVFTSAWGDRDPIKTAAGWTESFHYGVDYGPVPRGKQGVPLCAVFAGRATNLADQYGALGVRVTAKADARMAAVLRRLYGRGQVGSLVQFDIWHVAKRTVGNGVDVADGQQIAVMGSTGRSTGVHTHGELRIDGVRVDPKPFIDAQASKAVADAPADYYEEDDVALTEREKGAIEALWKIMPKLQELVDRYPLLDSTYERAGIAARDATAALEPQRVMGAQVEQLFVRRGAIDQQGVRIEAIHAALPALQQARDVSLDADDVASLAASLAAALPKTDAQSLIDALAAQLSKP